MDNILKKGYGRVCEMSELSFKMLAKDYGYTVERRGVDLFAFHNYHGEFEVKSNTWFVVFNGVFKFVRNEEVAMLTIKRL